MIESFAAPLSSTSFISTWLNPWFFGDVLILLLISKFSIAPHTQSSGSPSVAVLLPPLYVFCSIGSFSFSRLYLLDLRNVEENQLVVWSDVSLWETSALVDSGTVHMFSKPSVYQHIVNHVLVCPSADSYVHFQLSNPGLLRAFLKRKFTVQQMR